MASIISAGTSAGTAIAISGDTTGNLAFQTQAGANTITVPNATGTMLTTASAGTTGTSMVLLGTATANNSAQIDFTGLTPANYSAYKLIIDCAVPVNNAVNLLLRVSSGGTFQTSGYTWQIWRWTTAGQAVNGQIDSGTGIALDAAGADNISNTANRGGSWVVDILCPTQGTDLHRVLYQGQYFGSTHLGISGAGYTGTNTIDGIRLLMDSGNISTGRFFLYGIKNA